MEVRPSKEEIDRFISLATKQGLLRDSDNSAVFYSTQHLMSCVQSCRSAFGEGALHTIAVKALPFLRLLRRFSAIGYGAEVASHGELEIALAAGFVPQNIVFDSPAKTRFELEYALSLGCHINADNFDELERIDAILASRSDIAAPSIGLRVNPQVGAGAIQSTSVAGEYSKFGVPLKEQGDRIVKAYARYDWLDSIHFHIGSQGCSIDMLVDGAAEVDKLMQKINAGRTTPIRNIDMGGGLPASYNFGDNLASFDAYASALFSRLPHWQERTGGQRLITEFGRHIVANAAWAVSNIEYVKPSNGLHTVICHLGADMFLRKCYRPDDWHHEISVYNQESQDFVAQGKNVIKVAGPLCFAGDIIGEIRLAEIPSDQDRLIIHDVGGYTVSMWSRYNSRYMPVIFEYDTSNNTVSIVKQAEIAQDLIAFWS